MKKLTYIQVMKEYEDYERDYNDKFYNNDHEYGEELKTFGNIYLGIKFNSYKLSEIKDSIIFGLKALKRVLHLITWLKP